MLDVLIPVTAFAVLAATGLALEWLTEEIPETPDQESADQ